MSGELAELLAAAAAPAPAADVAGEDAAGAAFRAARHEPLRHPHQSPTRSTATALLAARVTLVVVVLLGAGGLAIAATTGGLPNPLRIHQPTASDRSRASQRSTPAQTPPPASERPRPSPSAGPSTAASADLRAVCADYAKYAAKGNGHIPNKPAFRRLIAAAGGQAQVAAYCAEATSAPSSDRTTPGHSGSASKKHLNARLA